MLPVLPADQAFRREEFAALFTLPSETYGTLLSGCLAGCSAATTADILSICKAYTPPVGVKKARSVHFTCLYTAGGEFQQEHSSFLPGPVSMVARYFVT